MPRKPKQSKQDKLPEDLEYSEPEDETFEQVLDARWKELNEISLPSDA